MTSVVLPVEAVVPMGSLPLLTCGLVSGLVCGSVSGAVSGLVSGSVSPVPESPGFFTRALVASTSAVRAAVSSSSVASGQHGVGLCQRSGGIRPTGSLQSFYWTNVMFFL